MKCTKRFKEVKISLDNTDFSLLSEQKLTLLKLIESKAEPNSKTIGHLQGLVHFLDHVQDQAVEAGVPEKTVFPTLGE